MSPIPDEILLLLQCPVTEQPLVRATPELTERANRMIYRELLTSRSGEMVEDCLDDGLVNEARAWLYPVRDGIVNLLPDDAIPMEQFETDEDEASP